MPAPIIDGELWALIEPLLPPPKPRRKRYPGPLPLWLHGFRRLRIRFGRRSDIHEAFLKLACSLVCWNSFTELGGLFELAFKGGRVKPEF
jgi:hypothetical protein